MGGFASRGFDAPWVATTACMFACLCRHLQIPVRHARAGVGPGITSHSDLGAAGGGHHDPSDDPVFMEKFVRIVDSGHREGHFPDVLVPHKAQKPFLQSPDGSTSSLVISIALGTPDVRTISGLEQALKKLGYLIAVDGDYGPERDKPSQVSRCTPESSPPEFPARKRKQAAHRAKPLGPVLP